MAFPTTGILDSFTGSDETPIATNWSGPIYSTISQLRRLSNKLAPSATAFGGSWYDISTFGPNCEVYATIDTLANSSSFTGILYARAINPNTTNLSGYIMQIFDTGVGGSGAIGIYREDNGSDTQIGSSYNPPGGLQLGDKYGMSCVGAIIAGFYCPVSTGIWTSAVISATDATYGAAGFLGVALDSAGAAFRLDQFGGGTIAVTPPVTPTVAWWKA